MFEAILVPVVVTLLTEILKIFTDKMGVKTPNAVIPASMPAQGVAVGSLLGIDPVVGALLGASSSWLYETAKETAKNFQKKPSSE